MTAFNTTIRDREHVPRDAALHFLPKYTELLQYYMDITVQARQKTSYESD
jgi:hypothetical protein